MIVRVLHGTVLASQTAVFIEQARGVLAQTPRQDGLIHAHVGRQSHADGTEEIVFVTVWRDMAALYEWIGGTDLLDTPVLAVYQDIFTSFDVQHYEGLSLDGSAAYWSGENRDQLPAVEPAESAESADAMVMGALI